MSLASHQMANVKELALQQELAVFPAIHLQTPLIKASCLQTDMPVHMSALLSGLLTLRHGNKALEWHE
jgi:hypothetical protein